MANLESLSSKSLTVCLLVGCYPGEDYGHKRIDWLRSVIDDICRQTLRPSHVLISINSSVSPCSEKEIRAALARLGDYSILKTYYPRNATLNFEMLLAVAHTEYVSFWSDHDYHSPSFCETLISCLQSKPSLGLIAVHDIDQSLESLINCELQGVRAISTSCLSTHSKAKLAVSIPVGSIYGMWRRAWLTRVLCSDPVEYPDLLSDVLSILHGKLDIILSGEIFAMRTRKKSRLTTSKNAQSLLGMRDLEKGVSVVSVRSIREACDCINIADKECMDLRKSFSPGLASLIAVEILNGRSRYINRFQLLEELMMSLLGGIPLIGSYCICRVGAKLSYSLRMQFAFEAVKGVAVLVVNYLCVVPWLLRLHVWRKQ